MLSLPEMAGGVVDLRQLRYFIAVAERGGFAAAANTLHVAQSALSRHVKELEREMGGNLLERNARGVTVTESGKVLLARGRWLLGAIDDVKTETQTENREPSGTVRIALPSSLADIFYGLLAASFTRNFPRVRLELSEGLTESLTDRLLRSELDLAVLTGPRHNDHLEFEMLVSEQVFLIGRPDDPLLLRRGALTRKAFASLPSAIVPLSRNPFPASVPYTICVESSTPLKRIVAQGIGYGLMPYSGIYEEVEEGKLAAASLPWMRADRIMALPKGRPVSRATREAVTTLKRIADELVREGKIRPFKSRKATVVRQLI
jgi:LysR family transcriptional regulator, nitrogen assimilation regulatory protein